MTTDEGRGVMVKLYLEKADDALSAARTIHSTSPATAVNRAYYACFYAASAVLIAEGRRFAKHAGVRGAIHEHLVRTGRLPKELASEYGELMVARHQADYEASTKWTSNDAEQAIHLAERVIDALRKLVE